MASEVNGTYPKGKTFTLAATATSGLAVTYSVSGPATLSGSTLSLTGAAGTISITAAQSGNATHAPASPVTVSLTNTTN